MLSSNIVYIMYDYRFNNNETKNNPLLLFLSKSGVIIFIKLGSKLDRIEFITCWSLYKKSQNHSLTFVNAFGIYFNIKTVNDTLTIKYSIYYFEAGKSRTMY